MYDMSCSIYIQETFPVESPGMPQSERYMYNFIFCHGSGSHLSHLPRVGIQCFGTETNGCEFGEAEKWPCLMHSCIFETALIDLCILVVTSKYINHNNITLHQKTSEACSFFSQIIWK